MDREEFFVDTMVRQAEWGKEYLATSLVGESYTKDHRKKPAKKRTSVIGKVVKVGRKGTKATIKRSSSGQGSKGRHPRISA